MTLSTVPEYDSGKAAKREAQALVVGAGVAGLCTARVLADYFTRVIILERDSLPESPRPRRGVPQGPHVHVLFTSGMEILDELLPGYGDDLLAAGAVENDYGSDWTVYSSGGFRTDIANRIPIYSASRPLFEQVLRRNVTGLDAVEIRPSHHFVEYVTSETASTVVGASVRNGNGEEETIASEVVIDATGRTSKTPKWLENHGYPAPPKQDVQVDLAYSSGSIERPPDDVRTIKIFDSGDSGRVAEAHPIENDRWLVSLTGRGDDHPPTEPEAMESFAGDLVVSNVKEVLDNHDWHNTEIAHHPFPSNQRYGYEDLDRFPDGLVVIGDAVASFNPVYGQGMTVAIFEALVLHHTLAETGLEDLGRRFFQQAGEIVDTPWFQANAADSGFPETTGPTPAGIESYREFMGRLRQTTEDDGEVAEAAIRVGQLERPLSSLLQPRIARRVFDETDGDTSATRESPAWVPSSLSDVGLLLEENLHNPKGVLEWPSIEIE